MNFDIILDMAGLLAMANVCKPGILCTMQDPRKSEEQNKQKNASSSSTDWISSSLTRRFGLSAGLGYVGFLAFGVISEQIKTRTEVALEQQGTRDVQGGEEVVLPNGIRYMDLTVGGGVSPKPGDLVAVDLEGKCNGESFVDTVTKNRPVAFVYGARPYSGGMCEGIEYVLKGMKAGGKRKAVIPADVGFGQKGAVFEDGKRVGANCQLEYVVQLKKVSIAP